MKFAVVDKTNKQVNEIELSDAIFGIEPNESALHAVVVNYLANQRQGTQSTLTRGEVRGGGKKPWRQKGTGRARQGSTRSPQWYHGGVALGPKPRSYRYVLNKKLRRLAMKSAFSAKVIDNDLIVLNTFAMNEYKTSEVAAVLKALGADKKALIVLPENDSFVVRSARNIPGVKTAQINTLNVYDILNANKLIIIEDAVAKLEEVYA
ncbi:MAG: 50S ribosomal protein L4 [Clostridia bacterium]|nr:50S ribosomal protein L4 [Oscillospiraceae bacterium]MBQ6796440.1 50S ribosomal protein L4 [Clostridia bacterium]